jgi:GDP-L-fucose synthase
VIPALIRRFHEAKVNNDSLVVAWGSGKPMREFLCVDDMAEASIFVMNLDKESYYRETQPMLSHINVGTGVDCTIKELTETVAKVVGFTGEIEWDTSKPDGTYRKLMDVSRIERLGWKANVGLEEGLSTAYAWFKQNQANIRS